MDRTRQKKGRHAIKMLGALCLAGCLYMGIGSTAHAAELTQYFNTQAYADAYPDLKAAFGYDGNALLNHYFTYGINEGRTMPGQIDLKGYRARYADLDAAFGNNWKAYAEHYDTHGKAEGRDAETYSGAVPQAKPAEPALVQVTDYNSLVQRKGNVSDAYMAQVLRYWALVPDSVKADFARQGWHVEVTSDELHIAGYSSRILALTSFDRKTIFISNRDAISIAHETGHYVDWRKVMCHNNISDAVWQGEKGAAQRIGGGSGSNYNNKQEYFAQCYGLYLTDNTKLAASCPQTYAFIQSNWM